MATSHPVGCQLYLPPLNGGHAVVVYAAFPGPTELMLRVADPADGALLTMPYSQFRSNYRNTGGTWLRSYTTH